MQNLAYKLTNPSSYPVSPQRHPRAPCERTIPTNTSDSISRLTESNKNHRNANIKKLRCLIIMHLSGIWSLLKNNNVDNNPICVSQSITTQSNLQITQAARSQVLTRVRAVRSQVHDSKSVSSHSAITCRVTTCDHIPSPRYTCKPTETQNV